MPQHRNADGSDTPPWTVETVIQQIEIEAGTFQVRKLCRVLRRLLQAERGAPVAEGLIVHFETVEGHVFKAPTIEEIKYGNCDRCGLQYGSRYTQGCRGAH